MGGAATGTVSQVTPANGSVYIVTVNGITGNGTLGLNLVDNGTIHDLAGNPLRQQNAPLPFLTQQTFGTGLGADVAVVGDVNGDGIADLILAVGGPFTSTLTVLLGNGNGTFRPQQTVNSFSSPLALAFADVNSDGKPDLVIGQSVAGVRVLLGNGNGTFQFPQEFATTGYSRAVAIADLNGDGKPDIVAINSGSSSVSVLLGNGNGTFQTQQTFATGPKPHGLALADVNGDAIPDIVVAVKYAKPLRQCCRPCCWEMATAPFKHRKPSPLRFVSNFGRGGRFEWRRQTRPGCR